MTILHNFNFRHYFCYLIMVLGLYLQILIKLVVKSHYKFYFFSQLITYLKNSNN